MDLNISIGGMRGIPFHGQGTANTQLDVATGSIARGRMVAGLIVVSVSAAPASAVRGSLISDAGGTPTTLFTFWIPAAATSPIVLPLAGGMKSGDGKTLTLRIPQLGAGVIADATLWVVPET